MNALKYLTREYGICDEKGKNYFLDYLVRTKDGKYAIEENGVNYHHPQIIGEEKAEKLKNRIRVHFGELNYTDSLQKIVLLVSGSKMTLNSFGKRYV